MSLIVVPQAPVLNPITPPTPPPALFAPTLTATGAGSTSGNLVASYTTAPPTVGAYIFEYAASMAGPFGHEITQSGASLTYNSLTASTTYYARAAVITTETPPRQSGWSNVAPFTTAPVLGYVKWNNPPSHWMCSSNINGWSTANGGNGRNANDFATLASSGSNIVGWIGVALWPALETSENVYAFVTTIIQDFNALQAAVPGAHFGYSIESRVFGSVSTSTSPVGQVVPSYILTSSAYGDNGSGVGPDGTHYGYCMANLSGGVYLEMAAAIWRPIVMARKQALFTALANFSFETTAGPYAGQTFTPFNHPLWDYILDGDESDLAAQGPGITDYSWSKLLAQIQVFDAALVAAWPHTVALGCFNWAGQGGTPDTMTALNASAQAIGMGWSCPDVYGIGSNPSGGTPNIDTDAQQALIGNTYSGGAWNIGGSQDQRGRMPIVPNIQYPDYGHGGASVAQILSVCQTLGANAILWVNKTGAPGDWVTQVLPVINGTPDLVTACPVNLNGECQATGILVPVWSAIPAFNFTQGTAASYNLNTYCEYAASFALASGSLETGVTLNDATGVLSYNGTSPTASSGSLTFAATNTYGTVNSGATTSAISAPAPLWAALLLLNFTQGTASTYNLNAYCANATSFALQSGAFEAGVTLNGSTGVLSYNGTSPAAASSTLIFSASNGVGTVNSGATSSTISAGVTFNFFISPTGSDSNAGTQASPWAITAINSKQSTYSGKSVGVLPGTYNVYALCQALGSSGSSQGSALSVNGGTSGSPTLIQSTVPRAAIITGANPSGGGYPTVECQLIGQGGSTLPPQLGNVIIDGLYLTRGFQRGVGFYLVGESNEVGGYSGIEVRNCEIFDIGGTVDDNVAGIFFQSAQGAWVHHNKIHSVQPSGGGNNQDVAAIFSYYSHSNIYEYNTIYDCNQGWRDKFYPNGNHFIRYNYVEINGTLPIAAIGDGNGGKLGDVYTVNNNIFNVIGAGAALWYSNVWPSGNSENTGYAFFQNTCLWPSGQNGAFFPAGGSNVTPNAKVTNYGNIYKCAGTPNYQGVISIITGNIALSDYNLYSVDGYMATAPYSNPGVPALSTLASFRTANGSDAHSAIGSPTFTSPTSLNPPGFKLTAGTAGSASGSTPGRIGGLVGGALTDMGAWGGASPPAIIGCNF
jgi:hypothetical protein